jgi:hypothetical protein
MGACQLAKERSMKRRYDGVPEIFGWFNAFHGTKAAQIATAVIEATREFARSAHPHNLKVVG